MGEWTQLGLAIGQRTHYAPKARRLSSKPIRKKKVEKTLFDEISVDDLNDSVDDLYR